ncbi:filamentous hemagglutinin protein [Fusobacterium necrophorum subsp. funduliforme B35]|uniref:hemagglutinin repeat-containing protein n=1 Tax=Fusobacterium necrophorum TaxID=859 RepID=UPI000430E00E|nr:hemagglutinin repeat-containing protein [Fusobacterium necrophorum]EYD69863.1 filamentous hemagglutinin protein [Fusobacterium necrophorum subsp. funduliforme B35]
METIERRLESLKERKETEIVSNIGSSQNVGETISNVSTPVTLSNGGDTTPMPAAYISGSSFGSMHGNSVLVRAHEDGFYGVQYSSEQTKNSILIDKETGEVDVKDLSPSLLTPRAVRLTSTSDSTEYEEIPEEDIKGNEVVAPVVDKAQEKKEEEEYSLEEEEVTEEDITEADRSQGSKNVTKGEHQESELKPRAFKATISSNGDFEPIPEDAMQGDQSKEEEKAENIPAALTSSKSEEPLDYNLEEEDPTDEDVLGSDIDTVNKNISKEEHQKNGLIPRTVRSASSGANEYEEIPKEVLEAAERGEEGISVTTLPANSTSILKEAVKQEPAAPQVLAKTVSTEESPEALALTSTAPTLGLSSISSAAAAAPAALISEAVPVSTVPSALTTDSTSAILSSSSLETPTTVLEAAAKVSPMALTAESGATSADIQGVQSEVGQEVLTQGVSVSAPSAITATSNPTTVLSSEAEVSAKELKETVPVSDSVEIAAASNTTSTETPKEAVKVEEPKVEVLKKLNHIEVKDPSKTQLEKIEGHDKSTLVQIATANDNGISHNEYDEFSIESDENVLLNNNSGDSEASSKLLNGKTFAGNKNLKDRSASLIINEVGLNNRGATKLAGGLEVLGKKSDVIIANENGVIVNGGRFENVGDLTLSTGKYKEGKSKEDFQFEERKGNIDVLGKSDIQNNLNIYSQNFNVNADLTTQNLNVDASGEISVKNATVSAEDIIDIKTKTLKNSNAKIQSKNAVKIKGEDISNEENSKISADVLLIEGKKVENAGEIEASDKLGIHATEDIINRRVIAGNILDLKAGKSFQNIDSALLYAQNQLQVDANEISNIGSSILSNGSLFLRGENAITNEKGGMIQSKGEGRLIGRKITNNASSISSLGKLYLKTDELLNIGEFKSAVKVSDQVRKLYKHVDVRESFWKAWYNGYNITVSIPRAKKELKVKQASINAGDDLVISKYKNDKTQVYNRDSSITAKGNIYVEGSVDNLTTTSASTLENILKGIKVKLAWNTSSLVDRSQFSSGVDVEGASLFDLLKEKDKLKRHQYFNLLKGLNDPELDRILNLALGADWKAKDDIPDLKSGGAIEYYSADNRAKIDSSKNIFVEGDIENSSIVENVSIEQWKKEKPKVDQEARKIEDVLFNAKVVMIGDQTILGENAVVDGVNSRKISVLALLREKDPKKRKEYFEKLKTIHDPKLEEVLASTLGKDWKSKKEVPVIKEGYAGKKKKENTIYQMVLEDGDERPIDDLYQLNNNDAKLRNVLQKQNGKYEKVKDNKEFLFKTSDVIKDKVEYKGYNYLVEGLKSKGKTIPNAKLIGDSQYQYDMISNLWKSYNQQAPDKEYIEGAFENSLEEAKRLNLEIGKPLTEQQQKELNRSIIWYVEKEIEGEKVLTPVMYFPPDKLHNLNRMREDKAISNIGAWGNIFAESDNVTNENSTINAVKNIKLKANVLVNRGNQEFDSDIYAGKELDIETKKVISEFANLKAMGNIDVTARNIDVKASDIVSKSNVNLRAESIDIKDEILKSSTKDINSKVVGKAGHSMEEVTTSKETSRASNIQGKNVYVKADDEFNVKGSKIKAEENVEIDAGKINIEASKTKKTVNVNKQGYGVNSKGLLEYRTEQQAAESEETNASSIEAGKYVYAKAKEDLKVKGSDITAKGIDLTAKRVTIENETEKSSEESSKLSAQVLGVESESKSVKATKGRASNVNAKDYIIVKSEEEGKIKGSKVKADNVYVNSGKTKFEAAEETYEEKTTKTSVGFTASGSAGLPGVGVEGEADGAAQTADGAIVNEYKNKKLAQGTSGGRKSSALAEGDIGVKLAYQQTEKEVKKFENSTVEGRNIYVSSEGETDIGGADISSEEETDISGKKILTTKQKNTVRESSTGFEVSVKQSGGTVSSILDAANVGKEIADDSKKGELNKGLAAAKAIGAATGLLFNDLAGAQSKQSINFSFNKSKSEVEEDTRNKVHSGGKIRIRSTEEDINLKNVDIKAKDKITLDSERDIKVSGGKRTEKREGHQLGATVHLQESAGFGAVSGGNTTVGIGGSANYETEKSSSTTNENSNIQANNLEVRSKKNTEVKGANVRAEETAAVKVGGKLTVKSEVDEYKEEKIKANAGASGSVGVSSNTIATALGNISAGGGYLWKEGQKITERTGFTAGKRMDIEVGGDLDVDSATVGSDTKKGNLDVKGEIRTKDRTTYEKSGGAVVGGSAGLTGEIGMDLEIGDKRNREVKSNSVLSFHKENISAKKVIQNGKESDIDSLKTSRIDETEVVRDEFEKGGSANLSFSVNDTKKIAGAVKGAVKNVVQKVRAHASTSDNASSSRRASNSDEANTPTRRQQDSAEDIYSKLAPEGAYSLAQKPGAGAEDGAASRRNATDSLPEAPNTARKTKSSSEDGVYETIPARNQNSDPTYSKVGPENTYSLAGKPKTTDENATYATVNKERKGTNDDTYSLAQRPQVEAGEGIKYKENELYGTGNRRNPSDSLPEVPNESRRTTSPSEERIYETISENRQRFEDIYSKRGPENTYSFVKQPGAEAGEGIRYKENDIYERGPRRNANDPLPEVPGMRKSSEVSDGIYETIPARNQNSDPTYSTVGAENTYSFVQRPQVDAGNGIKYKENDIYGMGIRRNPTDPLPELPNALRRRISLSEDRVYETIPARNQNSDSTYSTVGAAGTYSLLRRPGTLNEAPVYATVNKQRRGNDDTYSKVSGEGIYSLAGKAGNSEATYENVGVGKRGKAPKKPGRKKRGIEAEDPYSVIDDNVPVSKDKKALAKRPLPEVPGIKKSSEASDGIYETISTYGNLGAGKRGEAPKKPARKKRATEADPYSVIDDNGTVPQDRKALAKRPLPETPNKGEEVSKQRPESVYATIEENGGIQPRSNRRNSGDYEQLPDSVLKFGTEDSGAESKSRGRRSVGDENPYSTIDGDVSQPQVRRQNGEAQSSVYEKVDDVGNSKNNSLRVKAENSEDIYAKINPNTKRKPTQEEINQKRDKELTEKFGPKTTVHVDDGTYATVKRTGVTGEVEGVLTPRAASQRKNSGEEYERIPDSLKSGTEDSETGINSRGKRSTGEEESPYSTIKGEPNSETEAIQPRSNRGGDSDYEELPDVVLRNGTSENEAGRQESITAKSRRRRSLETEATDSSTSQVRPSNMEAPQLPPRNSKNKDQVHVDELGRVIVPESQLDTISLGENTYRRQLENKLHSEAVDKLTITDTSVSNTNYVPKKLTEQERDAFFDKIKREAEKRDPHKETMDKIKKIAQDPNDIPKEHVLKKLEEYTYGYNNEDVLKLVTRSAEDGTKVVAPDTLDRKKIKEGRKDLGEIFHKLQFDPQYDKARKEIDNKIYETLSKNPEFKEIMNKELAGNREGIQKLFNQVVEAKKSAFKEVIGVDIETPKLILKDESNKKVHTHGYYLNDEVNLNIVPPTNKKRVDKRENNTDLLNTIIHELTHHDQSYLAQNKDNPALRKDLQTDARLFGINQDLYVDFDGKHKTYQGYRNQPLERDAFHAGDTLSERLMKEVYKDPSTSFGNTDYKPKTISEKERKKLEKKAKKNNESEFTDTYNNFRKNADEKLLENLSKNSDFKKLMNGDLNGDAEKIKDLIGVISKAKKDSLEALGETNIPKSELKLKEAVATTSEKSTKAEQNLDILNNILKQYTYKSGVEETQNLVNKINGQVENKTNRFKRARRAVSEENVKDSGSANYVPKKLSKQEQEQLFKEARQKAKDRDSAKEAEKKLKLLAENADRIPKEHMLKAVKELAYGLSVEDATALRKKAVELGTKIHRPDMIEGFEGKNVKNMGEILKKIQFDQEYVKTREEINQKIVQKLDSNKEFHDLMKQKLSGNEEGIKKLFKMVESAKHDSLKEVTGIDGKRAEVVLNTERGPLSMKQGHYADNEVNMNAVPLLSFLRTKKQNNKEILDTIVHELTHHDQAQITRNKDRKLPEHMKQDADLMALNETYYINSDLSNFSAYKNQPLEREAFISGHKLGEQLSKLVDKGYTGPTKKIEEIVHLPSKNKNLEASRETGAAFGDSALIYGLKDGRKELLTKANKADKEKKNPIIADSYIGELNLGFEFSRLSELAHKVKSGKLSEQEIDRIVNYRDPNMDSAVSDSLNRINKANTEDNKRILTELLENEIVKDSLKRMDDLNQREKDLTESLKKNQDLDLDEPTESPNYTAKQNEEIREYNQIKKSLNDARMDFFAEKTKLIAKKVLDEGGQLYFSLDGLATDTMRFNKDKTTIDMNRLKEVFNPESEHYNAVTSKELRYLYENYKDNPNLKFMIKDQIVENPLKTLEISEVKRTEEMGDSGVAREKRILPQLFKKSKTEKGPVIKHLGGEETTSHYFPLDKIVTRNADISKDMKVNLENIKKAFTPGDKHYNDSESKSLREMYKKDSTMEQTKFIIGNQVIANPFKNPELQEYIKSQQGKESQVTASPKKAEVRKAVKAKVAGGQETSSTQEPIYAQVQKRNRGQIAADSEAPNKPLPPIPTPRTKRGVTSEASENQRTLRSQENAEPGSYYTNRVVNQTSQAPSTGEPVYADLTFRGANSKNVRNGHVESDYAEVGRRREEFLEAPTRPLPPIPGKPKVPEKRMKRALKDQENAEPGSYYTNRVVNQTSQASSAGDPVYADLTFRAANSKAVRDGGVESDYAEVGRTRRPVVMEKSLFPNPFRGKAKENGSETLSGAKKKALFDDAKKQAKQRDTAKEAEKKLKLLAENADSIPKEHMLKAVKELAYGLSVEDATALRKKAVELGTKIHRPDMIEGFEGKNVKNMGEILKKIQFDQEYVKTREEINQKIVEKLDSNKEFHDLMKQKLSGNEEGIKKLFKMVESAKHDSLKEVTGIDGKRAEVVLNTERGPLSMKQGHYADNEVNMNAVPLLSFLRTKKQNNKEILDTIVHELTHHDQAQITRNKDRKLPEHMKQDADLMALNETYYINSDLSNFSAYKNQPLEREAFISGHKLGEQLSKLVDKGYTEPSNKIEEIVHLPSKNKNLEASRETGAAFGDSALIYGLKDGRKELLTKANKADKEKKNPIIADSYIGELNLGFEFSRLSELAHKVNSGKLSEQEIDRIVNYRDPNMDSAVSDSLNRINKANTEDNKRILTELLQNETVKDSLKRMDDLNQRERDLTESLKKNEDLDLDEPTESPNYTAKQNEEIREYNQIKKSLNDARMDFFAEKTKLIAKKVLDEGGQLYFSLDGLATDSMRFNKDKTTIDMNRLKEVFNPESEHYNAVTSKELRYLYENYKDNPNLKFTIKDHVIENPLKTLKVEEVETASARENDSVVMEKSLLPKFFKKKSKDQGPVIKHLGGEETTSHYFPLDKIVTKNADISRNMKVNLDNIKKAFTPDDRHYHDSESKSLREMYKKDPTMEQTKFIIGNQVIENPFKNPELQEYIKSQQGREAQVVTKGRKAEAKRVVNPKAVGGQETSSTQEPIYAQVRKGNRGQAAANLEAPNKPLPPVPVSRVKRGAANESSSNQRALRSQESGFVEDGYYVDRVVNQSSQVPSRGEPIYADLQFGKANSGRVRNGHVESDYAEVGKREEHLEAPTRALPPIPKSAKEGKALVKPKVPGRTGKQALQTQESGFAKDGYYVNKVVNQSSQAPSTGEPVYADLQFGKMNSGRVKDGHLESEYAEIGRKNMTVSEETIYENVNSLQKPALPPRGVKTPVKPALPNRKPISPKK